MNYDIAIVGSGIAGLSAALYAARYEMKSIVIGDMLGGATSKAWIIENYPGFKAIDGFELIMKVKEQVEALGVSIETDRVIGLEKSGNGFALKLRDSEQTVQAKTVLLAVGAARRKLGIEREDELAKGRGVHYCATCDAPLYKGRTIGIVGGGDASVKGMNLAAEHAAKIYAIIRDTKMNAEPINFQRLEKHMASGKVEVLYNTEIAELLGENRLNAIKTKDGKTIEMDGLFVEIGAVPEVELAQQLGVKLDDHGYIAVDNHMQTNVPGIYAAGDTTNFFGHFKQDITAAAMGSVAATSAFTHIGTTQD